MGVLIVASSIRTRRLNVGILPVWEDVLRLVILHVPRLALVVV